MDPVKPIGSTIGSNNRPLTPTAAPAPAAAAPTPAPFLPPQGLSAERQSVLAQHYMTSPDSSKPGLVAHFRAHGTPEEKAFIEKLAGSRN